MFASKSTGDNDEQEDAMDIDPVDEEAVNGTDEFMHGGEEDHGDVSHSDGADSSWMVGNEAASEEDLDATAPGVLTQPDNTYARVERCFRIFEAHRYIDENFVNLDALLNTHTVVSWIQASKKLPLHALVAFAINNYAASHGLRGKLRHSWGVTHDEGVIVFADADWSEEEASDYVGMQPLQRVRACTAWSTGLWQDSALRVATIICMSARRRSVTLRTGAGAGCWDYDLRYTTRDKEADTPVLVHIADTDLLCCAPLSDFLACPMRVAGHREGPWMAFETDEWRSVKRVSKGERHRPNWHLQKTWAFALRNESCAAWAAERAVTSPYRDRLLRVLVDRIDRDCDNDRPVNFTWATIRGQLIF